MLISRKYNKGVINTAIKRTLEIDEALKKVQESQTKELHVQ
jgi:hypothetical protein